MVLDGTALEQALFSQPNLLVAQKSIQIAVHELAAIRASNAPQVNAEAGLGANKSKTQSNVVPSATVSVTKSLNDGGRTEAAISSAEINLAKLQISYALTADTISTDLARALLQKTYAQRGLAAINEAMARYEEKRSLIEMAHASGAITNAVMYEIEDAALNIEQRKLDLRNQIEMSNLTISYLLESPDAQNEAEHRLSHSVNLAAAPNWRLVAAERDVDLAETQRLGQVAAGRPSSGLFGGIRVPATQEMGAELFVGLRVQWTISDAGRNAARVSATENQRDARALQVTSLREQFTEADRLSEQRRAHSLRRRLLLEKRAEISKRKIAELEQLVSAGRADIGQIGREILSLTETQLGLIELEAELTLDGLSRAGMQGSGCAYLDLCGAIEKASFQE